MSLETLKPQLTAIIEDKIATVDQRLQNICNLLTQQVSYYDWVGFYFANHESQTLHLGPYVGAPTDHTVIPFGKGICGQVAVSNNNFVEFSSTTSPLYNTVTTSAKEATTFKSWVINKMPMPVSCCNSLSRIKMLF